MKLLVAGRAIDFSRETLLDADGRVIDLRPQAYQALRHLALNVGRLVSKEELLAAVWPQVVVTDDSLVQAIGDVRRALGEAGHQVLKTVPRRGYLLVADATAAAASERPEAGQPVSSIPRMPADITFCSTADGTKLALSTQGAGRDVVIIPVHFCDELDAPGLTSRPWLDALVPHARVTRFDTRGCGLSDRDAKRFSFDAWVEDLDAVVRTLGGPVALVAHSHGAPMAVHYASTHPQLVTHLVIYGGFVRGRSRRSSSEADIQETKAQREAILAGWGSNTPYSAAFRRVFIRRYFPHASEELIAQLDAAAYRRWSSEVALAYSSAGWEIDVSEQAPGVRCPSLIFHATHDQAFPLDEGRRLAALIPGSRFIPVESENHLPMESDSHCPAIMREVTAFLGLEERNNARRGGSGALTPRQVEVLRLVATGHTDKQIARSLRLSPRTVEMHVGHALEALDCRSRAEAVRIAVELRLLG